MFMLTIEMASEKELATMNALGQMVNSSMRTIAPVFATSLFAASIDKHLMGGTLVYWVCFSGMVGGAILSEWIPTSPSKRGD